MLNYLNRSGLTSHIIKYTNLKKELLLSITGLIIAFTLIKLTIKIKFTHFWLKSFFFLISLLVLGLPYFNTKLFQKILNQNQIIFHSWDRAENCRNNGMLLCFIHDLQFFKKNPLPDYNQTKIEQIFNSIDNQTVNQNQIHPNIIVILSESFWDVTKLPNTKFDIDPIQNVRADIKGNFISPTFGGETANVEFELITGLNNYFFENNSYPYTDIIKKDIPSLFTVFKDNGYLTSVIHPYSPWFYNRQNVYKNFGLDKFTNLSNMTEYENAGPFVSEKSFTKSILDQLNSSDQTQFVFAISIQNHAPYEANRFTNPQIKIDTNLNESDFKTLQSYTEGIYLSDQYYQILKEELQKLTNKPTIIILFGDHLPFLGPNFDIYKKTNFISQDESNWNQSDQLQTHITPLTIWSNYQTNIPKLNNISPSFLSNQIINLANLNPEYQFKFTQQFQDQDLILNKKINIDEKIKTKLNDYQLIQYDLLFGKRYTWQYK